jgi:hypothetical protein
MKHIVTLAMFVVFTGPIGALADACGGMDELLREVDEQYGQKVSGCVSTAKREKATCDRSAGGNGGKLEDCREIETAEKKACLGKFRSWEQEAKANIKEDFVDCEAQRRREYVDSIPPPPQFARSEEVTQDLRRFVPEKRRFEYQMIPLKELMAPGDRNLHNLGSQGWRLIGCPVVEVKKEEPKEASAMGASCFQGCSLKHILAWAQPKNCFLERRLVPKN